MPAGCAPGGARVLMLRAGSGALALPAALPILGRSARICRAAALAHIGARKLRPRPGGPRAAPLPPPRTPGAPKPRAGNPSLMPNPSHI